ncbi:hypothetical protein [Microbulbifer sp. TYP-18]|uniref:hypothetical protein n=1 Tax=Microbulbifer sp. TYP-18 TaxID=3230024 RepID=UPI0034C6AAB9
MESTIADDEKKLNKVSQVGGGPAHEGDAERDARDADTAREDAESSLQENIHERIERDREQAEQAIEAIASPHKAELQKSLNEKLETLEESSQKAIAEVSKLKSEFVEDIKNVRSLGERFKKLLTDSSLSEAERNKEMDAIVKSMEKLSPEFAEAMENIRPEVISTLAARDTLLYLKKVVTSESTKKQIQKLVLFLDKAPKEAASLFKNVKVDATKKLQEAFKPLVKTGKIVLGLLAFLLLDDILKSFESSKRNLKHNYADEKDAKLAISMDRYTLIVEHLKDACSDTGNPFMQLYYQLGQLAVLDHAYTNTLSESDYSDIASIIKDQPIANYRVILPELLDFRAESGERLSLRHIRMMLLIKYVE